MKLFIYFLSAVLLLHFIEASAQDKKKIVIASTPDSLIDKQIKDLFISQLGEGLTRSGQYTVVQNRAEFADVLNEEAEFQKKGYVDDNQQLELGKALGADYACYVAIQKIGKNFSISCKLLDIIKGESVGQPFSDFTENGEEDLIKVAYSMAKKLAAGRDVTEIKKDYITVPKFYQNGNGDVVDYDIDIQNEEAMSYPDAVDFCKKKGDGWRLPTKEELFFIYRNRPAMESESGFKQFSKTDDYWSSTKRNDYESYVINFGTGQENFYSKNIRNIFRCIRSD